MSLRERRARSNGFTLIELIVALFITAIIFAVGYGGISQSLKNHEQLKEHQARLTEVQNAVRVMVQDFSQLSARPIRDPQGQSWVASITTAGADASSSSPTSSAAAVPEDDDDSDDDATTDTDDGLMDLVAFTRGGWANPAGIQRSTLERVSYRFANGTLRRMHWPVLDGTEAAMPVRRDLLTHVSSVAFRFMNDQHEWVTQWPATGSSGLRARPFAVEITLQLEDWGHIVRIIEVAS